MTISSSADHTIQADTSRSSRAGRRLVRLSSVIGSAAAAALIWTLAVVALDIDLRARVGDAPQEITVIAVVATVLLVGAAAWALLALFERLTRRAQMAWTILALVVALLSLLGPTSATSAGAGLALVSMHVVVAIGLIWPMSHSARRRRSVRNR